MSKVIILGLLSMSSLSYAMNAQPGQIVSWHTRAYTILTRQENSSEITITMERPTRQLCGLALSKECITRAFKTGHNDGYPSNTYKTNKATLLGVCMAGGTLGTLVIAAVAYYAAI